MGLVQFIINLITMRVNFGLPDEFTYPLWLWGVVIIAALAVVSALVVKIIRFFRNLY